MTKAALLVSLAGATGVFLLHLHPVASTLTRAAWLAGWAVLWGGLLALTWRRRWIRVGMLLLPGGIAAPFFLPARPVNPHALRAELIERLQALVGEGRWLQADPGSDRVVLLHGTRDRNEWFGVEVALHRWAVLFAANGARTQPTATDPTENRG